MKLDILQKIKFLLKLEFLKLDAKYEEKKKEEPKTCGWKPPIYLFESAAQNGKIPPENMR